MSGEDRELQAIQQIAAALDGLDLLACDRVLKWARERFVDSSSTALFDEFTKTFAAMAAEAKARGLRPGELERAVARIAAEVIDEREASS